MLRDLADATHKVYTGVTLLGRVPLSLLLRLHQGGGIPHDRRGDPLPAIATGDPWTRPVPTAFRGPSPPLSRASGATTTTWWASRSPWSIRS